MKVICTLYINCPHADKCSHSKSHEKVDNCGFLTLGMRYCLYANRYVNCKQTTIDKRKEKLKKLNEKM